VTLRPGQDLHIIACPRGAVIEKRKRATVDVHGVRWAAQPELGFPLRGFSVLRLVGSAKTRIGTFFLPRSDSWTHFRADAEARRPALGPYFPSILKANLGYLSRRPAVHGRRLASCLPSRRSPNSSATARGGSRSPSSTGRRRPSAPPLL
jgi:hypothetical protein